MKDLFYRPDLKPKRDYMSDAEVEEHTEGLDLEDTEGDTDTDEDLSDDLEDLIENIDDILDVIDILPEEVRESLDSSLRRIREDADDMRHYPIYVDPGFGEGDDGGVGGDPDEFEPVDPVPLKPTTPEIKGPALFPINDSIPVVVVPPKPLRVVLDESFRIDKTEIYRDFVNRLRLVIELYMREILYISEVGGFPTYKDLFYDYNVSADEVPVNYKHIGDGIIRNQIQRGQKAMFFRKVYNIDHTIFHLRSNKASHELRKRYYDSKFQTSKTYLETQGNDLLRATRMQYDKKYEQNMYNFYKYLNGAVILVDEVLQTFIKEAKGKAILNKQGVDIFKGYREEKELAESIKKKREKKRKEREKERLEEERARVERYKTAGRKSGKSNPGQQGGSPAPSGENANIVELAQQWARTRGKGSANPVKYSMERRGSDMELKQWGDCSSFTRKVFLDAGKGDIGWTTAQQATNKKGRFFTNRSELQPGDLMFFSPTGSHGHPVTLPNGKRARTAHVAIYIGGTKMVDLSYEVGTISIKDFSSGNHKSYVDSKFLCAVRH